MKKITALVLALALCLALAGCGAAKKEEAAAPETTEAPEAVGVHVNVSISNAGALVVTNQTVVVPDEDGDGQCTIDEALIAAHDAFYEGGAAAGYRSEEGDYGMSIKLLWGVENGDSYGYYVNNGYVLPDAPLVDGDTLYAYSYADLDSWSDAYSYFDSYVATATAGEEFTLTLRAIGYDESYNTVILPVEGATVTVDGVPTEFVTAEDGSVNIVIPESGAHTVSAISETAVLVPPVCTVTVK